MSIVPEKPRDELTYEEMQAALIVLLEKTRLSPKAKNDIRFAKNKFAAEELNLRHRLAKVLIDTPREADMKRERP